MPSWLALICLIASPCLSDDRGCVLYQARSLIGVREWGVNTGPEVDIILSSVGLEPGNPWCAAFNYYVFRQAGYGDLVPRTGWSPSWLTGGKRVAYSPPASVFGIYFNSLGRIAHTGIIEKTENGFATTIEGNTNSAGGRGEGGGDGVYRRKRSMRTILCRDWLK